MYTLSKYLCFTLLIANHVPMNVQAETTYVYKQANGTVLLTNVRPPKKQRHLFNLIKTFHHKPKANGGSICKGMTESKLEKRARPYRKTIKRYAKKYQVNPAMVQAIISVESCFNRKAVSRAGAQGLMQLMPATAKTLGVIDSFNSIENIKGGIKYFSKLMKRFDNATLALAAYNAGPGAVAKYNGIPPYKETQQYVKRVLKRYQRYRKHPI